MIFWSFAASFILLPCFQIFCEIFWTSRKGRSFHLMCKYANADLETISRGFNILQWAILTMKICDNGWYMVFKKTTRTTIWRWQFWNIVFDASVNYGSSGGWSEVQITNRIVVVVVGVVVVLLLLLLLRRLIWGLDNQQGATPPLLFTLFTIFHTLGH